MLMVDNIRGKFIGNYVLFSNSYLDSCHYSSWPTSGEIYLTSLFILNQIYFDFASVPRQQGDDCGKEPVLPEELPHSR